jgi:hypothetical protein
VTAICAAAKRWARLSHAFGYRSRDRACDRGSCTRR